jgi:hypothetical protein
MHQKLKSSTSVQALHTKNIFDKYLEPNSAYIRKAIKADQKHTEKDFKVMFSLCNIDGDTMFMSANSALLCVAAFNQGYIIYNLH